MVSRRQTSSHGREAGQSLVEFALILPVLLLITVGVLDAGRVFAIQNAVTNASRVAALFAGSGGYMSWCRNPDDPSQKAPLPAVSVPCPTGASLENWTADPSNIAYRVNTVMGGLDPLSVVLDPPQCGNAVCTSPPTSQYVSVTVRYRFNLSTPLVSSIFGDPVIISATTTARILE